LLGRFNGDRGLFIGHQRKIDADSCNIGAKASTGMPKPGEFAIVNDGGPAREPKCKDRVISGEIG
jgi:hypothetical protein